MDDLDQANNLLHLDLAKLHQMEDLIHAFNKALHLPRIRISSHLTLPRPTGFRTLPSGLARNDMVALDFNDCGSNGKPTLRSPKRPYADTSLPYRIPADFLSASMGTGAVACINSDRRKVVARPNAMEMMTPPARKGVFPY
jgi:hypothetical protein